MLLSDQTTPSASSERVSWGQLIAYGTGGIIPIALFNIAPQLMALLGNISLGLSAFWLGVIMFLPRLWDAVSDPVLGYLSDNTRSRWGRRRPFLLLGGIAVSVSFVAMWWVPRGASAESYFSSEWTFHCFQLIYILGGVLVFFTACTAFEIPHGALGLELSEGYHDRTRLFSAKSFFGNMFSMGTPWLIAIASWEKFSGTGGDLVDGMRYVSLAIAAVLIPLSFWWFFMLRERRFAVASNQPRTRFWQEMRTTASNRNFLRLIAIIFTLAIGFNFVNSFENYITIFYLYESDVGDATKLLGIGGTVWAIAAMLAVFPLNWLSQAYGKNKTLLIAIGLMALAQILKIICYNPAYPFLVLIPKLLLSAGMLMFFTLGASMVGDVCDEDELNSGTRSEGSYYSVFWWFVKTGTALASLVMGSLLVLTNFNETLNVKVNELQGSLQVIEATSEEWNDAKRNPMKSETLAPRRETLNEQIAGVTKAFDDLYQYFQDEAAQEDYDSKRFRSLLAKLEELDPRITRLTEQQAIWIERPDELASLIEDLFADTVPIKQQSPRTLFLLRVLDIGVPLILCLLSAWLTLKYPLTEERCYEIKALLEARRTTNEGHVDDEASSP